VLKLVSVALVFFVTVQCWAAPWDGSITANNVWNPAQDPGQQQQAVAQQQPQQQMRARNLQWARQRQWQ
jgi:hypothetical protein